MQELEKILEEIDRKVEEYMEIDFSDEYNTGIIDMTETAKTIIRKHMDDGWIPVDERLPTKEECKKDNNNFLVQVDSGERFSCEYDPEANGYDNPQWCCNIPVVAWRPLPEPYQAERSDNNDGE